MKKTVFICTILVMIFSLNFLFFKTGNFLTNEFNFLFENVEALADGEEEAIKIDYCYSEESFTRTLATTSINQCKEGTTTHISALMPPKPVGEVFPCRHSLYQLGFFVQKGFCYKL